MTSKSTTIKIKEEPGNDLQSYLESFNNEISEGNVSGQVIQYLNEGETDVVNIKQQEDPDAEEEEEEGGTYFIDQAGNYYYQATKDSDPVLTSPPEELSNYEICDDEEQVVHIVKKQEGKQPARGKTEETGEGDDEKTDEVRYVVLMDDQDGDGKDSKSIKIATEGDKDEVFEFDENDEEGLAKDSTQNPSKLMKIIKQQYSQVHMCNFCSYTSPKRYLLARHMKCHSEERPHKCTVCERGFKTIASLHNHVNTHTGTKPYHCKFCEGCFTTSGELVRHIRYRHTHEKPHKCTECDYASVELSKLKRHIRCHTGERPYQCPHCTYASPDTFKLKRHLRIHTGEKPYECDICHARFTQSNSLKAHKLIHSVGDKPVFQCELCPTTCGRKTDLRIHVQKLHTSDKPLKCKRCDKMFPDRYTYKVHAKTHEGEKCYKCDICPYASISARHLESHLLIHTDQKPFECPQCDQAFRQKQLLKRHINLYHDKSYTPPQPREKTHLCPHCDRKFRHKGNLIRHMALHDPESGIIEESYALRVGRQRRVQYIDGQEVEIVTGNEDEDDEGMDEGEVDEEEEGEENTIITTETEEIHIKQEADQQNLLAVKGSDGHQYVVLEVIQMDGDGPSRAENMQIEEEEYMLPAEITEDNVPSMKTRNLRVEPQKLLSADKNVATCFGFDDADENMETETIGVTELDYNKQTIKLEIKQ